MSRRTNKKLAAILSARQKPPTDREVVCIKLAADRRNTIGTIEGALANTDESVRKLFRGWIPQVRALESRIRELGGTVETWVFAGGVE